MKKITLLLVLCCFTAALVNAQTTAIPDANFEQALIDLGIDTNGLNGNILNVDAQNVVNLNVGSKNISDLSGIETFTSLTNLWCYDNLLTSLDVTQNTALIGLSCYGNLLTNLDVTQNTALTQLGCFDNQLTSLDVSQNIVLEGLGCYSNQLTNLNVSQNPALQVLYCFDNLLTNLVLNQNTLLTDLNCDNNQLTDLDLSQNTLLTNLRCATNNITALDLSQNSSLTYVFCPNNQLTSMNMNNGNNSIISTFNTTFNSSLNCITVDNAAYSITNWTNIDSQTNFSTTCSTNTISIPDANFEQALINLGIDTNGLNGSLLEYEAQNVIVININNKNISDLTGIEAFVSLQTLYCNNNALTSLNVTQNINLQNLTFSNNQLTNIDLSQNIALTSINCSNNQLTSLDISLNTLLTDVSCYDNQLSNINTTQNSALDRLNCYNNQINNLDVTQNTLLRNLYCYNNQIGFLDLSLNTELRNVNCSGNQLTNLDLRNGNNNNILSSSFNTTNNPTLQCIDVDDVAYSTANWNNIDVQTSFGTNCGPPQTYIPDNNFEQVLIDLGYDSVLDDYVTTANISNITALNVNNKNITDLIGIEDFVSLTTLRCRDNQIVSLDLSQNTNLTSLRCYNNNLTSLNVKNGNNTNVTVFNATNNPNLACIQVDNPIYSTTNWGNIDAQTNFSIDCSTPQIFVPDNNFEQVLIDLGYDTVLDNYVSAVNINTITDLIVTGKNIADLTGIDGFVALENLSCGFNQLTNLNLLQNPALIFLSCRDNQLTSLDISQNTVLKELYCFNNQLTSLDVTQNAVLEILTCAYNPLTSLNVTQNTGLKRLDCSNNQLTSLDVSQNVVLESLSCDDNQLTSLDVTQNTALTFLRCYSNLLTSLNVKNGNNVNFTSFDATNNSSLTCINVDDVAYSNTNWTDIDAQTSFSLDCSTVTVAIPDANFEQALISLGIDTNGLNGNVLESDILGVTNVNVNNKNISDLTGIEAFISLTTLRCRDNQITSLDLSQNTSLVSLRCHNNQLTNLDVKNGNNANVTAFNATNNPSLTCINVDDIAYSTTNWTNIDAQTSFSTNCTAAIQLSAKVYLQGAATNPNSGEGTWMRDDLRVTSNIPATSPYTDALTCNASVFNPTGANAIIDWVFVELRDQANSASVLASQSALLQRDGDVVAVDGVSPLSFNIASGNYFVAVTHRNHIGVISASTFSLSPTTTLVDFSSSSAVAQGGTNALTNLGNGIYAIYTGDFDGNAQIQNTDATAVIALLGGSGYTAADMDVNGQIQNTDVNNFINPNIGKGQQFAKSAGDSKAYSANAAHNITFSFANAQNTNDGTNDFYEVDVLIQSDQDFKLGSGQLYFNYNTAAFGNNISTSGTIEYTQPTNYILGAVNTLPIYGQFIQNDNTTSRVSLSWQQALSSGAITSNNVTATPTLLFHIKIQYIDVAQSPTVCFEQDPLFLDQTFTACGPTTFATVDCTNFPGTQLLNDNFNCIGATLSVAKLNLDLNIKLYPNPAKDEFRIEGLLENSQLEIYNLNGVLVLNLNNYKGKRVDVSSLSASVYFVKISNGNATRVKRLIVE